MDFLLLISIGCFFALFVAALAIARHVRLQGFERRRSKGEDWRTEELRRAASLPSRERLHLTTQRMTEQDVRSLIKRKHPDWRFLVSEDRRSMSTEGSESAPERKRPVSVQASGRQRPDWAYFERDHGDLRDPYQAPALREAMNGTNGKRR